MTLNFFCAVAVSSHEAPSQFHLTPRSDHHCYSTDLGLMTFSASTMERTQLHDINSQQSFKTLPLKPNVQIKNMVAHDRNNPIQESSGIIRTMNFAAKVFRNTTIHPDLRKQASDRSST
jgi:hypothetical protein